VRPYVGAAAAVATLRRYPRAFFYGLQLSLGVNEFGTSRGFEIVTIPAAYYDDAAKCLKGATSPTPRPLRRCVPVRPGGIIGVPIATATPNDVCLCVCVCL
jgi:hypothetical protein